MNTGSKLNFASATRSGPIVRCNNVPLFGSVVAYFWGIPGGGGGEVLFHTFGIYLYKGLAKCHDAIWCERLVRRCFHVDALTVDSHSLTSPISFID